MPNSFTAGPGEMSYDDRGDHDPNEKACRECGDGTGSLCDLCWLDEKRRRELNEAIYVQAIQKWFRRTEPAA